MGLSQIPCYHSSLLSYLLSYKAKEEVKKADRKCRGKEGETEAGRKRGREVTDLFEAILNIRRERWMWGSPRLPPHPTSASGCSDPKKKNCYRQLCRTGDAELASQDAESECLKVLDLSGLHRVQGQTELFHWK